MGWKISDLQGASLPLTGNELIEVTQGENSRSVRVMDLLPGFDDTLTTQLADESDLVQGAAKVARATRHFDSVSQLRTVPGRYAGDCANLTAYNGGWAALAAPIPTGGGPVVWDDTSTEADNGVTVYAVDGVSAGRWKRPSGPITASQAGAVADFNPTTGSGTDNRAILQAAIAAVDHLIIDDHYGISVDTSDVGRGLSLKNDFTLSRTPKGKLSLLAHNATIYQMVRVWGCSNVTINGADLDGRRTANAATGGEFGMGIDIRGGSNVRAFNATTNNMWGDGMYVGLTNTAESTTDLYVEGHRAKNCRRQGLSLVSARRADFVSCVWEDTNGTAPSAGADVEPNGNTAVLEGIRFINCKTKGNEGSGIVIELGAFAGAAAKVVDIEIIGHMDDGSTVGCSVNGLKDTGSVKGSIKIKGSVWKNNLNQAFQSVDYHAEGPEIEVSDYTIVDCNRNGQTSAKYGSATVVLRDTGSTRTDPIGNVTFKGASITRRSGTILKPAYFDSVVSGQDNTFVKKVYFKDPVHLEGLSSNALGFFGTGGISDAHNSWVEKLAGTANLSANIYAPVEFADASSNITLSAGQFIAGQPDIIIRKPNNTSTHDVVGPAAGAFVGLAGTVTRLRSVVGGSYLRLRPMGSDKFLIVERVGAWTEV